MELGLIDDPGLLYKLAMTDGKHRQQVVRKLVQLGWSLVALDLLDERCDCETFEMVLLALPMLETETGPEYVEALLQMKALGYKRSALFFERAAKVCESRDAYNLFKDRKSEHEAAASSGFYAMIFQQCTCLEHCLVVVKEAVSKGVDLHELRSLASWHVIHLLLDNLSDLEKAAEIFVEVGKVGDLQKAYDIVFQHLSSIHIRDEQKSALETALMRFKTLGLKRSIYAFEAEIWCSTSHEAAFALFLEMKDECEAAASRNCYQEVLDGCQCFDHVTQVVREAKRKGHEVLLEKVLLKLLVDVSQVPEAVSLLKEYGSCAKVDHAVAPVLRHLEAPLGAVLFEEVVKDSLGPPFPEASKAFLGKAQSENIDPGKIPSVVASLFSLEDAETLQQAASFLHRAGHGALACQFRMLVSRKRAAFTHYDPSYSPCTPQHPSYLPSYSYSPCVNG